jgi:putative toxin-antitoxin system antitoxin component (TIGR02293 family)
MPKEKIPDKKDDRSQTIMVVKTPTYLAALLVGGSGYKGYFAYPVAEKIAIARKGISKKQLLDIKNEVELDYDQLAKILAISRASLISKKGSQKFSQDTSERILLLNDVLSYGYEIFGNKEGFNEWLKTPSEALGNITPLSMMDTYYGLEEIKHEIGRIAYGVY